MTAEPAAYCAPWGVTEGDWEALVELWLEHRPAEGSYLRWVIDEFLETLLTPDELWYGVRDIGDWLMGELRDRGFRYEVVETYVSTYELYLALARPLITPQNAAVSDPVSRRKSAEKAKPGAAFPAPEEF